MWSSTELLKHGSYDGRFGMCLHSGYVTSVYPDCTPSMMKHEIAMMKAECRRLPVLKKKQQARGGFTGDKNLVTSNFHVSPVATEHFSGAGGDCIGLCVCGLNIADTLIIMASPLYISGYVRSAFQDFSEFEWNKVLRKVAFEARARVKKESNCGNELIMCVVT